MATTRRRGRPALKEGEASTSVHVRLAASDYDNVDAQSRACRMSIPEVLRRSVRTAEPVPMRHTLAGVDARLEALERCYAQQIVNERAKAEEETISEGSFADLLRKALGRGLYA